jgi:hypothetical protein
MSRGFVFTTDGVLAVTVALTLAAASLYYIQEAGRGGWDEAAMVRSADDIGLALDREGLLGSDNMTLLEAALNGSRPNNYAAGLRVSRYVPVNGTLMLVSVQTAGDYPAGDRVTQRFVSMGRQGVYVADVGVALR